MKIRERRARKIVSYLKKAYPRPKSELKWNTPFQFVVAVILSAQCTDRSVNRLTDTLFLKYKTSKDFARADPKRFEKEISSIPLFRNKARFIISAAKKVAASPRAGGFGGKVPRTAKDLQSLQGIGYKTAHVVLGELYDIWEGIATDTHVRRFAYRFDLTDSRDPTKISKELEALIPKKDWKFVNNGLVLYGRYVCRARKHDCSKHPLTLAWPNASTRWISPK